MTERKNRYKDMERMMTRLLLGDLVLFILYLIAAGCGIIWLKATTAIIAILLSGLCLLYLYMTQELLKKRSLWISVSAAAVALCILFSLILNYPSPNPYKEAPTPATSTVGE